MEMLDWRPKRCHGALATAWAQVFRAMDRKSHRDPHWELGEIEWSPFSDPFRNIHVP